MAALLFLLDLPVVANKHRHYLLLLLGLALASLPSGLCSAVFAAPAPGVTRPVVPAIDGPAGSADAAVAASPIRPMSKTEVYELLQAELLLRRGDSAAGFRKYLALARSTRDPGIIAFTAKVGVYLDRRELTEVAQLWVQVEPGSVDAHRLFAQQLQKGGGWQKALDEWVLVRQFGGTDRLDSWLSVVENLDPEVSPSPVVALRNWRRQRPADSELLRTEAMLLLRQGRIAEGLAGLASYPQQTPEILETRVGAYLDLADIAGARSVIALAQQRGIDVRGWRYEVAMQLLRSTRLADARAELESLVGGGWDRADALLALAYVALQQGDSARARAVLGRAPDNDETHDLRALYLGQAAELERRLGEALEWYTQVQPGEHFIAARSRAASVLMRLNRLPEARDDLTALRDSYPEDAVQYFLAEADVLQASRDAAGAVKLLTLALSQSPAEPDLLYGRAMAYLSMGSLARMEADLRTALRQDPDDPRALNALGFHLADRTRRYSEALALIQRAAAVNPEDAGVADSMGWVLYRLGRRAEALIRLQDSYRRVKDAGVAARLGEVLWVSGQRSEARRIWQEGLRLDRTNAALVQTMDRLLGKRAAG